MHKKGKSRITMQDRESAAEDSYRRVNKRETSSMSHGVRRSAEESKENMSGRSVYEEIRGPTGQTTEHPVWDKKKNEEAYIKFPPFSS